MTICEHCQQPVDYDDVDDAYRHTATEFMTCDDGLGTYAHPEGTPCPPHCEDPAGDALRARPVGLVKDDDWPYGDGPD